jgi:hypothetical protein
VEDEMPTLRLDLDRETYDRLLRQADAERRPVVWQAEVILRRALGPVPAHRGTPDDAGAPDDGGSGR